MHFAVGLSSTVFHFHQPRPLAEYKNGKYMKEESMKKKAQKLLPFCLMAALLTCGCAATEATQQTAVIQPPPAAATQQQVYKGKVVGKSNKAKIISLEVGKGDKAKTITIKFDKNTKGIEHAAKGHGAIIAYEKRGNDIYATSIKQKLAKMPAGVTEISVADVKALIDKDEDFELIDSRPAHRYSSSHLPGAISIPVCEMKELIGLLPKHKDKLLIFYCGGPT